VRVDVLDVVGESGAAQHCQCLGCERLSCPVSGTADAAERHGLLQVDPAQLPPVAFGVANVRRTVPSWIDVRSRTAMLPTSACSTAVAHTDDSAPMATSPMTTASGWT
jgi:hypothetical protein